MQVPSNWSLQELNTRRNSCLDGQQSVPYLKGHLVTGWLWQNYFSLWLWSQDPWFCELMNNCIKRSLAKDFWTNKLSALLVELVDKSEKYWLWLTRLVTLVKVVNDLNIIIIYCLNGSKADNLMTIIDDEWRRWW